MSMETSQFLAVSIWVTITVKIMSNSESQNRKVKEEESLSLIIQARTFFLSWNRMPKRDSLTRKLLMP